MCLKELASKKSVINHLKNIHDETDPENYECFQAKDISDKNIEPSDSKDGEHVSSVLAADLETNRPLDNAHYDALNQFGDVDALLDQEIKKQQTGGVLNCSMSMSNYWLMKLQKMKQQTKQEK